MSTVLYMDDDRQRVERVECRLRAALPDVRIHHVGDELAFRYEFATRPPQAVVLGSRAADRLVREVAALSPTTKIVVLTSAEAPAEATRGFDASVCGVATEEDLAGVLGEALGHSGELGTAAALDGHRMKNRIAGLMAGLHAMAAELRASAADSHRVPAIADEYVDRLASVVGDMCVMVAAAEARRYDEDPR